MTAGWPTRNPYDLQWEVGPWSRERPGTGCARAVRTGPWLAVYEDLGLHQGSIGEAAQHAAHAVRIAMLLVRLAELVLDRQIHHGGTDLAAIGMQLQGRALAAQGSMRVWRYPTKP